MKAVVWFGNGLTKEEFQDDQKRSLGLLSGLWALRVLGVGAEAMHRETCSCTIHADAATIERIRKELGQYGVEVSVVEDKPAFKGA